MWAPRWAGVLLLCMRISLGSCQLPPEAILSPDELAHLLEAARRDVDTLCSPELAGRGYQSAGHVKAAHFLAQEFKKMGLHPVAENTEERGRDSSFFQAFRFPLNLISQTRLRLDGVAQEMGRDFIPYRLSGEGTIQGTVLDLGYGLQQVAPRQIRGQIILIREGWPPEMIKNDSLQEVFSDKKRVWDRLEAVFPHGPAALLIARNKLTAGFSSQSFPIPIMEVQIDSLPPRVDSAGLFVSTSIENISGQNVIGSIPGTLFPDTAIILSAHYDHLGTLEDAIFPGANDNASGIAFMLSLIRHFSQPKNRLPYTLLCIAFGGEETGLRGSKHYVEQAPVIPLDRTKFILNVDLMGNGEKGIMAVGGKDHPGYFEILQQLNREEGWVPRTSARPNAPNSDQYFFLKEGIPGFFIFTMGGPPHYHDVNDTPENLLLSHFAELHQLFISFLRNL